MNNVLTSISVHALNECCRKLFQQASVSIKPFNHTGVHRVWRIKLQDGSDWIAKEIKSETWLGALHNNDIEFNETIASIVADELGVALPARQWRKKQYLVPHCNERILFIPYCKGNILSHWTEKQSFLLGSVLAAIHQLSLPTQQAKPFPQLQEVEGNFPDFVFDKIQQCNKNRLHALADWVTSHRDIHAANVIWQTKEMPFLIDWESTGLIHPFVELIGVAVNGAEITAGKFNKNRFIAVLAGYRQRAGTLPYADDHLWELCYHSWLLWLYFNWHKGHRLEVQRTLTSLQRLSEYMPAMKKLYM
ncbi:phosphotransferase [Legionella nagasakiensis]|uniref:phosphotransferase n=1 Tax=Legionella nagasakiensis TaxID=535290 RepID=UPI001054554B|nr:phosphotransferase [Legionella nagasakiensis]